MCQAAVPVLLVVALLLLLVPLHARSLLRQAVRHASKEVSYRAAGTSITTSLDFSPVPRGLARSANLFRASRHGEMKNRSFDSRVLPLCCETDGRRSSFSSPFLHW